MSLDAILEWLVRAASVSNLIGYLTGGPALLSGVLVILMSCQCHGGAPLDGH